MSAVERHHLVLVHVPVLVDTVVHSNRTKLNRELTLSTNSCQIFVVSTISMMECEIISLATHVQNLDVGVIPRENRV
jgi:hypothetical protein